MPSRAARTLFGAYESFSRSRSLRLGFLPGRDRRDARCFRRELLAELPTRLVNDISNLAMQVARAGRKVASRQSGAALRSSRPQESLAAAGPGGVDRPLACGSPRLRSGTVPSDPRDHWWSWHFPRTKTCGLWLPFTMMARSASGFRPMVAFGSRRPTTAGALGRRFFGRGLAFYAARDPPGATSSPNRCGRRRGSFSSRYLLISNLSREGLVHYVPTEDLPNFVGTCRKGGVSTPGERHGVSDLAIKPIIQSRGSQHDLRRPASAPSTSCGYVPVIPSRRGRINRRGVRAGPIRPRNSSTARWL